MEKGAKKRGYTKKEKTLLGICISFISLWSLVRSLSALRIWLSLHYASRFYFIIIYIFLLPLPFFFFGIPFICCVCWANIIERPSLLLLISLCALSFQIHLYTYKYVCMLMHVLLYVCLHDFSQILMLYLGILWFC